MSKTPTDQEIQNFQPKCLDTIEDIISAEPWQKFMRDLVEKPEESSPICFEMCTSKGNRYVKKVKIL